METVPVLLYPDFAMPRSWVARMSGRQFLHTLNSMQIPFTKLHPKAITPTRAHPTDAGADVYALDCSTQEGADYRPLLPGERRAYRTGLAISVPAGYYCRIAPRSGLAANRGINVLAGVVDSAFRGEIKVILHNTDIHEAVWVNPRDKIAQLIIEKCEPAIFVEVPSLDQTDRAAAGFGSTGS